MQKLGLAVLVASVAAGLASGCGGASEKSVVNDPGGTSAGGNTSAQSGSSNSEGGADDSSTGGTMGMPAAGRGGSAAGGASTIPMMPDPAVREGCDAWCDAAVEAACNDQTLADCLFGCRAIATSVACNARYGELFDCAMDATFSCNADGDAVPEGCEVEYASAGLCILSNPDETIEAPCQSYCEAQEAAECMNSTPAAECTYGCQLVSPLVAACAADWRTFVACAADSTVSCSDAGDPVPDACIAEYLTYLACYVEAGQ